MPSAIQPGRYGVVNSGGLLSWLIRKATHSPYDHAFIVGDNGQVVEAAARGVRVEWLSEYAGKPLAFNTGEIMTDQQRRTVVDTAVKAVNEPYSYLDLGALGLNALGWHWRWLFKLLGKEHVTICSQLCAVAGAAAGLDWMCGRANADEVTPADLASRPGVEVWTGPLT
jgi:uncharacterized protein YycO